MQPTPLFLPDFSLTLAAYEGGTPTGPPLLFIHGNSMAASTFQRQFAAPELQHFRLVAFDLPGHGHSPDAPATYGLPRTTALLLAAVRALGCEQALVVAHSYGGHLLAEVLPQLPRLRGALLLGAPLFGTPTQMAAGFCFDDTALLLYAPALTAAQADALARHCLRPTAPPEEVALLRAAIARTDGRMREMLGASAQAGEYADEPAHAAATPVPLAFVLGAEETLPVPAYFATLTVPTRWGPPAHVLPDAGHLPFLEQPAAFNALLLAFAAHAAGLFGQVTEQVT